MVRSRPARCQLDGLLKEAGATSPEAGVAESGGPAVSLPRRRGFGSRLIERGLAAEMDGAALMRFEPTGLVCVIDAPFANEELS